MKLLKALTSINYKDVLTRAGWTALQAFLAVVIFALEPIIDLIFVGDWDGLYALAVATVLSALAAALSAVKTVLVNLVRKLKEDA